jgi:hypothetical protein
MLNVKIWIRVVKFCSPINLFMDGISLRCDVIFCAQNLRHSSESVEWYQACGVVIFTSNLCIIQLS